MPIEIDPIKDLVERLNSTKKLRVWSVIITFFGDAIVPRGGGGEGGGAAVDGAAGSVSARTVQTLLGRMGIEAGAMRTAFSRLTTDGWVVREKLGRSSFFRLSSTGLAPFEAATDRIYAPLPTASSNGEGWQLVIDEDSYPEPTISAVGNTETDLDCFILEGRIKNIPDWMKSTRCQPEHKRSFEVLMESFAPLQGLQLAPINALAARCLLIHEWRRIVFQFHNVAPEFWTDDWPQAKCHHFVSTLYHQLLPASEQWMNEDASGVDGPLPPPNSDLAARFT